MNTFTHTPEVSHAWWQYLRLLSALLAVGVSLSQTSMAQQLSSLPILTRVSDVRALTLEQAKQPRVVKIRGVVTALSGLRSSFFFQDSTAGIAADRKTFEPELRTGDEVEVSGGVSPGLFAPSLVVESVLVLGRTGMPASRRFGYEQLRLGQQDSQWGEFVGVVHSATIMDSWGSRVLRLQVKTGGGIIETRVKQFAGADPMSYVDATIRVRGVFATIFNDRRQLIGLRSFVTSPDDVLVLQAPPADAFTIPARGISSLQRFAPGQELEHQVKLVGTVTYQKAGQMLYIQDSDSGVIVQTTQSGIVPPGQMVEAVGFASSNEQVPALKDARFRVIGSGGPLAASKVSPADVIKLRGDAFWFTPYDLRLVSMRGKLVDNSRGAGDQILLLRDGNTDFPVVLEGSIQGKNGLARLEIGSVLQATGVCTVARDESGTPTSFQIRLRSSQDVVIIEHPTWFSPSHLLWLVLIALAAAMWKAFHHQKQQKNVARELLRSRKQFQLFLDSSPILAFMKDSAGRSVWVNRACERLINFELWPAETARRIHDSEREVLEGGIPVSIVEALPLASGEMRHFVSTKFPFETDTGELMLGGTSIDITERVNTEALLRQSEVRYRELFEQNPVPAWVYCLETLQFLDVNEAALRHYGYSRSEFLTSTVRMVRFPEDVEPIECALGNSAQESSRVWRHRRKDGSVIRVELRAQDVENSCGGRRRLVLANDVTERLASEEKFRVLFEESSDAHFLSDDKGVVDCNYAAVAMLRANSKQEIIGTVSGELSTQSGSNGRRSDPEALNAQSSVRFDCTYRRFDGSELQVEVSRTKVSVGSSPMTLEVWHDLTARKETERRLSEQALTDPLTALPNRRHFTEHLAVAVQAAKLDGQRLSLCACDVDTFKLVNDRYGHAAGDDVLVTVGRLMRESVRQSDFVARMGGDEFCILFTNPSPLDAAVCLTRLQEHMRGITFKSAKGASFKVTLTFGLAELSPSTFDEESLAEAADQALYIAKEQGRNRIFVSEAA